MNGSIYEFLNAVVGWATARASRPHKPRNVAMAIKFNVLK